MITVEIYGQVFETSIFFVMFIVAWFIVFAVLPLLRRRRRKDIDFQLMKAHKAVVKGRHSLERARYWAGEFEARLDLYERAVAEAMEWEDNLTSKGASN